MKKLILALLEVARRRVGTARIREWRPQAEAGDANAQYKLGLMYQQGLFLETEKRVAL